MTSPQRLLPPHGNHYLFSDHYLDHVVQTRRDWREADVRPIRDQLAAMWLRFAPQGENEAQTEHEWVRPVLDALGHRYNVQVSIQTPLGPKTPDYVLFAEEAERLAAKAIAHPLSEGDLKTALAVADAKAWDRPLDQAVTSAQQVRGLRTSENPSFQIDFYMRHAGVSWGILTNGRRWRLYHRESSRKLDVYYEVDLPDLLEQAVASSAGQEAAEALKYFWLFFRREAFVAPTHWLESVLEESRVYARGVSESLEAQIYEALAVLAQGFLDYPANGLGPSGEDLKAIHDSSLILLYRLLFTLYAEDRGLLPVHTNQAYRQTYSLGSIKRQIAADLGAGVRAVASMDTLWHRLSQLWRVICDGNAQLDVQAYDGGLFDPKVHPFLEQHRVGDEHLRRAIDLVARAQDPKTGVRQFVDYRDLEIRHLGSIYEGLLEYQLRVAAEDLAVRREKGREVYVAAAQTVGTPAIRAGQTYLVTDKGERKATGSYYTPDYIVQYIVDNAVGPVLEELRDRHGSDPDALQRAVMGVNVLDPAMGSGHFLVAATDFVARYMVGLGLERPADIGDEGELGYWRRRVAQSCIYGVDLNPLAVELAKLSLWLATVAKDRPLSFLDHHLRCGNSLIGARMSDMSLEAAAAPARSRRKVRAEAEARAAGQLSMLEDSAFAGAMRSATRFMTDIETMRGDTLDEVHQAEAIYRNTVRAQTEKSRVLADVWIARHFGLTVPDGLWAGLVQHILHGGFALPQYEAILGQAASIAVDRRFFHWELEFPEVFFDEHGRLDTDKGGFDAVVGNPPYVRQEALGPIKPFLAASYASAQSAADLYLYFYEQGLRLLRPGGRISYISSGTYARANFAKEFRRFLPTAARIDKLIDFGENQPFEGAEMVRPTILVLKRDAPPRPFRALFIADRVPPSIEVALEIDGVDCDPAVLDRPEWVFQTAAASGLFEKLMALGRPLIEVVDGRMYRGLLTGLNEAFIVDSVTRDRLLTEDPRSAEVLRRVLRGEDLRPWYQEDEGRWLIVVPTGWTRGSAGPLSEDAAWQWFSVNQPAIADHLGPFASAARARADKGEYWWELRSCDYYEAFDRPKIFWPDIAKLPRFSWDDSGAYIGNTGYVLTTEDPWLLGLLQSRAAWYAVSQIAQPLRLRAGLWQYRLIAQFISRLPIPDAPTADRDASGALAVSITAEAKARYELHQRTRRRIAADLSALGLPLNHRLTRWWELDFAAFRAEIQKALRTDIPLKERDSWDTWLAEQRAAHERHTDAIVRMETELNKHVYRLFDLTPEETRLVEASTKYRYGEV